MRDFFYNKGDVLVAILIIAVAAVVIYFRVGIVMGSDPGEKIKELFSPTTSGISNETQSNGEDKPGNTAVQNQEPSNVAEPVDKNDTAADQTSQEEVPPVQAEEPDQGTPSSPDVTITVNAGDAASTIADKLLAAGVISDKQAFLAEVIAQKADSKLKQGTFTIPAGASVNDIIKILVG